MNRKCMRLAAISLMTMMAMTGCGNQIPDLTEEQAQQIGEYAAITLLKYDANHRSRLVDQSVIEEYDAKEKELQEQAPQATTESTPEGMKPVDDTPTIEVGDNDTVNTVSSLEELFVLPDGVTIAYTGHSVCDSYTGEVSEEFFALDASSGKKLLVLDFAITNQSAQVQYIELFSKTAVYNITINENYSEQALTTMLMNDLSTFSGEIAAGETKGAVLLIEIEENVSGNISSVILNLKNESKTSTIQLQ